MRPHLLRWGRLLIGPAILFFLIKYLFSLLTALEADVIVLQPFWFIASLTLLLLYFGGLGIPWFFLYRAGREKPGTFLLGWTFFQFSQLGRYLPGKVGHFVWMLSLSRGFGIEKTRAMLATCLQLTFQFGLGCVLGLPILSSPEVLLFLQSRLAGVEMFRKASLICIGIVALFGGVVFLYRRRIRETLPTLIVQSRAIFSVAGVLWLLAVYLLLWGLLGVAFFLFIKSLTPVAISQLLVVTGIYAVAWSIGFLSVITPSGLGVREGVLSLLLTLVGFPSATATLVSLLSRLWTLGAQLVLAGIAFRLYWQQRDKIEIRSIRNGGKNRSL